MTDSNESVVELKARIQRQLLAQIATLSKVESPTQMGMGTIEPLSFLINAYTQFMSAPTVTWDDGDGAK